MSLRRAIEFPFPGGRQLRSNALARLAYAGESAGSGSVEPSASARPICPGHRSPAGHKRRRPARQPWRALFGGTHIASSSCRTVDRSPACPRCTAAVTRAIMSSSIYAFLCGLVRAGTSAEPAQLAATAVQNAQAHSSSVRQDSAQSVVWSRPIRESRMAVISADEQPVVATRRQLAAGSMVHAYHYFLGFPSYWNVVAFYVVILHLSPVTGRSRSVLARATAAGLLRTARPTARPASD